MNDMNGVVKEDFLTLHINNKKSTARVLFFVIGGESGIVRDIASQCLFHVVAAAMRHRRTSVRLLLVAKPLFRGSNPDTAHQQQKKAPQGCSFCYWRRVRDSNPG